MIKRISRTSILVLALLAGLARPLPAPASTLTATKDGVTWRGARTTVRVRVCGNGAFRVQRAPSTRQAPRESLVVVGSDPRPRFALHRDPAGWTVVTSRGRARVTRQGAVRFADASGRVVLSEVNTPPSPAATRGDEVYQRFRLAGDPGLYGLGSNVEHPYADCRGRDILLAHQNRVAANPFLVSTTGWGLLWDNYSRTRFHDGPDGMSFSSEVGPGVDYTLIVGSSIDEVIAGYRRLTGPAPMLPRWALGYWQSKEHYNSQEELVSVAAEFRRRHIPIDVLVQDWNWWPDKAWWSAFRVDEKRYPDLPGLFRSLRETYHLHTLFSLWPAVGKASPVHRDLAARGLLLSGGHWSGGDVYDAYSAEARAIYWKHARLGLFEAGLDAWWLDGSEPEFTDVDDQATFESQTKQRGQCALGPLSTYLNTYSLFHTRGIYEGQRAATADRRVVILTRSAFAGQQRHGAIYWTGDTMGTFDVLRAHPGAGIHFSMSGIPWWTHDIGGFFARGYKDNTGYRGADDPAYRELYVRWFQFGAFSPIFRSHGTQAAREPWRFGQPGEPAFDAILKMIRLRYRLLPYLYSLAWRVTHEGYTIMRGLAMDFPHDRRVRSLVTQYMLGPAFLVTPVTRHQHVPFGGPLVPIPGRFLQALEGRGNGLSAIYYTDEAFQQVADTRVDPQVALAWKAGDRGPRSMRWTGDLVAPVTGEYVIGVVGSPGGRLWLNRQAATDDWNASPLSVKTVTLRLQKGQRVKVHLEFVRPEGASALRLAWRLPVVPSSRPASVRVQLPAASDWYDFWTGRRITGGQAIERPTPLDILPLHVRAGSIIPLGPALEYAEEKAADPIEIRVYPGADGHFTLYEDAGDGYQYEKGAFATIPISWHDRSGTLEVGARRGSFPGLLRTRTFRVVRVREDHGVGLAGGAADATLRYQGKPLRVKVR